ncbi:hypothetical protein Tco_0472358 [Tanacetum coccineum]
MDLSNLLPRSFEDLKPREQDTRRTSGNTTRNDPFPPFLLLEAQTQVIEQLIAWSGMDMKMAKTCYHSHFILVSAPERCLLPTALLLILRMFFSSMNILYYTLVSSDYFPASLGSNSFNSSENSKENMIPPVFSSFYNNPYLKNVQAFYAKESPISSPDPITSPAILTPNFDNYTSLLLDPDISLTELKEGLLTNKYCPRTEIKKMEDEFYGLTVNGSDLKTYIRRFQELAILCPNMVPNTEKLMEAFIGGLPQSIEGNITASKPQTLEEATNIAHRLMDQK